MSLSKRKIPSDLYLLLGIVIIGIIVIGIFSDRFADILYEPLRTPDNWHQTHPYLLVGDLTISEPSSSLIMLALIMMYFWTAYLFLRNRNEQDSRLWWAVFLIMFGVGALLAGVSYQAFNYEIKCRGHEYCLWTSWWEVSYMICTVAGAGAALLGAAHAIFNRQTVRYWSVYVLLSTLFYTVMASIGLIIGNRFLISFEMMVIFVCIGFIAMTILALRQNRIKQESIIMKILKVGFFMLLVNLIYFIGLVSGYADVLWEKGIWFNANDLLHTLLFIWVIYSYKVLGDKLKDAVY